MRYRWLLFVFALLGALAPARADDSPIAAASLVGGAGDEEVTGARLQSDGSVVLAVSSGVGDDDGGRRRGGGGSGSVVRIDRDGGKALATASVPDAIYDLDLDSKDRVYVAAGSRGVVVLGPRTLDVKATIGLDSPCRRVAVGSDGTIAALADDGVYLIGGDGRGVRISEGKGYTCDVTVDGRSKTVIVVGYTNNRAHDGNRTEPVQICYVWGLDYRGKRKYTLYDWSADSASERFLNKPENNMADTRALRCSIGRDGFLYVAFEAAGGNHLFRYSPTDITQKSKAIVGGDAHHSFHNSASEHKTVFGRYRPDSGEVVLMQQFCGRLGTGKANAVRISDGQITADEEGRVVICGAAAYGLPLTFNPPEAGEYTGGAFVLMMSADFKQRLLCTRITGGTAHAADARARGPGAGLVFAGRADADKPVALVKPMHAERGGVDGFFVIVR